MTLDYRAAGIFIWGLNHALGDVSRDLEELNAAGLLVGDAASLVQTGYHRNLGLADAQTFTSLVAQPLRHALDSAGATPRELLFQHALVANASTPSTPASLTRRRGEVISLRH